MPINVHILFSSFYFPGSILFVERWLLYKQAKQKKHYLFIGVGILSTLSGEQETFNGYNVSCFISILQHFSLIFFGISHFFLFFFLSPFSFPPEKLLWWGQDKTWNEETLIIFISLYTRHLFHIMYTVCIQVYLKIKFEVKEMREKLRILPWDIFCFFQKRNECPCTHYT